MRPDEHKKKKNAQYKKKHGIQAKKESKKEEIKKDKSEKPQHSEEKQENTSKNAVCETRRFSRRKVTSNWDRYEDSEVGGSDDAYQTIGRRGADFTTLIERAGDSHSQFRFQAEKEWEEPIGVQESQDVLKINFEDLSQSLNSLPLYKKLNIEENVIYSEHQEVDYDQRATTIKGMLKGIDIHDGLENIAEVNQKRSSNLSLNQQPKPQLNFNFLPSRADSPTTQNKKDTTNLSQSMKDPSSETSYGLNASAITGTLHSMGVIKKTRQQDDDELDFLLLLENGQHQENSIEEPLDAKKVPNNIPLEIDFKMPDTQATEVDASKTSLPLDKNTTSQDHSPSGKKSETPSDTQKPKEDLEDWLDSVLG